MSDAWKAMIEDGNSSFEAGKVPEAEVKFLKALEEAENFGQDDLRLALTLNNVAAAYHAQGKYKLAEPMYLRSLAIKENVLGESSADVALNHHNLAVLYSARRLYPVAEKHYKKAIEIKEELYGKNSPELVNTLNYYAHLMKVLNRPVDRQLLEARVKEINAGGAVTV